MKRLILSIALLFSLAIAAFAQTQLRDKNRDLGASTGIYVPMTKGIEAAPFRAITYTQYFNRGIGFKAGIQYAPTVCELGGNYGIPIAFSVKTRMRSTGERLETGAWAAAATLWENLWYGEDEPWEGMIASALIAMFSQSEYYLGITPGFITNSRSPSDINYTDSGYIEHYTQRSGSIFTTLDAGMNLNYAIWRFDIKLMPAVHYNMTGNYKVMEMICDDDQTHFGSMKTPRWFFSFGLGLSYRF